MGSAAGADGARGSQPDVSVRMPAPVRPDGRVAPSAGSGIVAEIESARMRPGPSVDPGSRQRLKRERHRRRLRPAGGRPRGRFQEQSQVMNQNRPRAPDSSPEGRSVRRRGGPHISAEEGTKNAMDR